jgi:hypothetical protein
VNLRLSGVSPVGRPRVAKECKDVGTDGSLDEMRTLVARLYDVTLLHAHHHYLPYPFAQAIRPGAATSSKERAVITYWQENRRTKNISPRRTGFVAGTIPLASIIISNSMPILLSGARLWLSWLNPWSNGRVATLDELYGRQSKALKLNSYGKAHTRSNSHRMEIRYASSR